MRDTAVINDTIITGFRKLNERFNQTNARIEHIKDNMIRKSDIFKVAMTAHGLSVAAIVGIVVALNAVGIFG